MPIPFPISAGAVNAAFVSQAQVSAANANRDGTGTLVDLKAATSNVGSTITGIEINAIVSTTAGMVRLFLNDGTNTRLYDEIPVTAVTASGSVAAFRTTWTPQTVDGLLRLPPGWTLKASTNNAEAMNIITKGFEG